MSSTDAVLTKPEKTQFSLRALLLGVVVCSVMLAGIAYLKQLEERGYAEHLRQEKHNRTVLVEVVNDIQALRAKLGRTPKDAAEVETLLGKPLPVVYVEGRAVPIKYFCTGNNSFRLSFSLGDDGGCIYDSRDAQVRWVVLTS